MVFNYRGVFTAARLITDDVIYSLTSQNSTSISMVTHSSNCSMDDLKCSQENIGIRETLTVHYFYIAITVLGIAGNSLAIAVILKSKEMRETPTNILIVNQSLIDLCTAIIGLLMLIFGNNLSSLTGVSLKMACLFWYSDFPFWSLLTSSSYSLVILSLERYLAINKPLYHRCHVTRTKVLLFAGLSWVTGPVIQLGLLLPTTSVDSEGCCNDWDYFPSEYNQYAYGVIEFIFTFLVPFVVVTLCSSSIYRRVRPDASTDGSLGGSFQGRRHSSLGGRRASGGMSNAAGGVTRRRAKLNLLKTLFMVVIAFALCNATRSFSYLVYNFGDRCLFSVAYFHYATCATYANCCVNPMVYAGQYKAYQNELKSWFTGRGSAKDVRRKRAVESFKLSISS